MLKITSRMGMAAATALLCSGMFAPSDALAHHSLAMFDISRSVTLTGTVYKFEWTNPHVWLWLSVPGEPQAAIWGFESGAPAQLTREGLNRNSFRAGDKITITARPARDGSNAGRLVSVSFADGHSYRSQDPSLQPGGEPPAPPSP